MGHDDASFQCTKPDFAGTLYVIWVSVVELRFLEVYHSFENRFFSLA